MEHILATSVLLGALGAALAAQDPANYVFQTDGLYMDGVKSLAEWRGRPVFIEYWGTR